MGRYASHPPNRRNLPRSHGRQRAQALRLTQAFPLALALRITVESRVTVARLLTFGPANGHQTAKESEGD